MKYILFFVMIMTLSLSCKKKKTIEAVNTNNSKDSLTYQPKIAGSKWTYQVSSGVAVISTYNVTCLDYDTVCNGNTYDVFYDEKKSNQYVRQDGGKYYTVLTTAANKTELMIIDTSKNINDTWIGGVNGTDTYYYTMKDKYPTYVLDGFTFKNVLKIYSERKDGTGAVTLSGDSYYAQGVGNILSTGTIIGQPVEIKLITVDLK